MNCKKCRTEMIGFLRGSLKGTEVRMREHLNGCDGCRAYAEYVRETMSVIGIEKEISPDPFLATRIEGILTQSSVASKRSSFLPRLIPALALSSFILAGVAGGIVVGKLIAPAAFDQQLARNELAIMMDDLQQEPIEAFIMGMNDKAEN